MNSKQEEITNIPNDRFQNILKSLSRCKIDFINEKEESKKTREINIKLEMELRKTRELEKSHRYHLLTSREMIGNLQETVSQLVYLKRDMKKLKDENGFKDAAISAMEKDKDVVLQKHNENILSLRSAHEKQIEELTTVNEKKVRQVQHDSDTQIAQFTCVIEELRSKIKDIETENRDKMNVVVLEYEEKIQRGAAQVTQLQEQLARQSARTDSNIDAYRRRLEELEEKLKQSQFKQYLAQSSYASEYESQVERPYSVDREYRDPYADSCAAVNLDPITDRAKPKGAITNQNKTLKPGSTLQVMYYGNKTPNIAMNVQKERFNITKKRKLFNHKDLQDF